jgi:hypothetical protein
MLFGQLGHLLDLSLAEQACRAELAQAKGFLADDIDADRLSKPNRFVDPGGERPQSPLPDPFRYDNERALATSNPAVIGALEDAQPSSSGLVSPPRVSGWPGCKVEMACL